MSRYGAHSRRCPPTRQNWCPRKCSCSAGCSTGCSASWRGTRSGSITAAISGRSSALPNAACDREPDASVRPRLPSRLLPHQRQVGALALLLRRLVLPHQRQRLVALGDAVPGGRVVLLEAPDLALAGLHHELAAVHAPGHRAEAGDLLVTAWLGHDLEVLRVGRLVGQRHRTDRLAGVRPGAADESPLAEQV